MLHSLEYGRHSLPLDLVEEFRSVIADTLALSLFNLGILKESDFYRIDPPEPALLRDTVDDLIGEVGCDPLGQMTLEEDDDIFDLPPQPPEDDESETETGQLGKRAVRLHPPAFIRIVKSFEKKIGTEFYHPVAEKRMTYAEAMVFQARQLRRVIEGEATRYQPLLLR